MKMYDADSLVAKLEAARNKLSMTGLIAAERNVAKFALQVVYDEPTIDAEPVRHGHWNDGEFTKIVCSECNAAYSDEIVFMSRDFMYARLLFCPNCGAKMDMKEDEHATD